MLNSFTRGFSVGGDKIKALILLTVFTLPLLFLCAMFSRIHEKIAAPEKFKIPAGTRVIILGDSHAVCSLDPRRVGRAVNFSSNGESYIHNYYKLRYALRAAPFLRTVVLPIDLHSFSDFRSDRVRVNLEWLQYIDYLEYGRHSRRLPYYLGELLRLRGFGFCGGYRSFFSRWLLGRRAPSVSRLDQGFVPKTGYFIKKNSAKSGRKRALRQLQGVDLFSPEMVFYFRKILDLASRHRLHVVLLSFPVTPEYLRTAEELMSIDRYYARIRAITAKYSHVHFINRQRLFHKKAGLFFRDAQHLNANGAGIFSGSIRRDLIALGLL